MSEITVFGQGKVGLALSACLLEAGHTVVGVDVDPDCVRRLNAGTFSTDESGVIERLRQHSPRFTATTDAVRAVTGSEVSFVIVPTPSNTLGGFSLRFVRAAGREIGTALRNHTSYHVVAVVSTMLPGASDSRVMPYLGQMIGRPIGDGWGYDYNPAFIALGEVVQGFVKPDYILIGESEARAGEVVAGIHRSLVVNGPPLARMSPIEAEITKIASNTHETMRVSFANMLFSLCSEIPGTHVDHITEALAHRMGKRFFKGAVPYGGPCWPRDNVALAVFMDLMGVPSTFPRTVDQFNQEHGRYVLRKCLEITRPGGAVAVLGLAYKARTKVIEHSFGINLARWLAAEGRRVTVWDPLAMEAARSILNDSVAYADSMEHCLEQGEVDIIVNALTEIQEVDWSRVGDRIVIDCWRCLTPEAVSRIKHYRPLGQGPVSQDGKARSWIDLDRLKLLTD